MRGIISVVMSVLPFLYRVVSGLLIVRKGVAIIPFVIGMVSSLGLMFAYWHETTAALTTVMADTVAAMQAVEVGTSNVYCWLTAFGLFSALRMIAQAFAVGFGMLFTQWVAFQTLRMTQYLLEAAIVATHR